MSIDYVFSCEKKTIDKIKSLGYWSIPVACLMIVFIGIPMLILTIAITGVGIIVGIPLICLLSIIELIHIVYQGFFKKGDKNESSDDGSVVISSDREDPHS